MKSINRLFIDVEDIRTRYYRHKRWKQFYMEELRNINVNNLLSHNSTRSKIRNKIISEQISMQKYKEKFDRIKKDLNYYDITVENLLFIL